MATCNKFHTQAPQILAVTVQNSNARATWHLTCVHPCTKLLDGIQRKLILEGPQHMLDIFNRYHANVENRVRS
jgi:hypothetical protein